MWVRGLLLSHHLNPLDLSRMGRNNPAAQDLNQPVIDANLPRYRNYPPSISVKFKCISKEFHPL
jgi:hypothetical protein